MKTYFLLVILGLVALTSIFWISRVVLQKKQPPKPTPLPAVSLVLDWTPNTNHTGIYVALAKGWYKDAGVALRILPYSSSVTPDVLVGSGKADLAISSTESVVANQALGQDVISIAAIIQHNTSSLAVLEDSGITRPKDLDGKMYGGFGAPSEEAVVNAIVKKDGGVGSVKNIVLDTGAMEALKGKRIDVVWIYDGWEGVQAQRDGVKLRTFPIIKYGIPDFYTPVIISSKKTIDAKADFLKKFMLATVKGYEYARIHPKEAAQMLVDSAPKGTFPDEELVFASQEYLSPRYADKGRKWGLQDTKAWQEYPKFLLDSKAIVDANGKPVTTIDFKSLYTNEFVQ